MYCILFPRRQHKECHKNRYCGLCKKKLSGFPFIEWQQSHTESPHIRPQSEQVYFHVNTVGHAGNVNNNSI